MRPARPSAVGQSPAGKPIVHPSLPRSGVILTFALAVGGCLQERLVWSPDGRHAAVVTADGLYVTAATGKISPLLVPRAYRMAWLPDSQGLVLARHKSAATLAEVSSALGPARTKLLTAKAEAVWGKLRTLPRGEDFDRCMGEEIGQDLAGILIYLREQPDHLAALREKFGSDWKSDDENKPVDLNEIVVAHLRGEKLEIGPTLWIGLPGIHSLRPAPGGDAVAFTMPVELSLQPDHGTCVMLAPTDASVSATGVATQSSAYPDWGADGRSLVFFQARDGAGGTDDLRLGALVTRELLDARGGIRLAPGPTDLVRLSFHPRSRVRCLRNGRVVFNATVLTLPMVAAGDNEREQLFALDRAAKAGSLPLMPLIPDTQLEKLPKSLSAFEVSPDESQVLFGSDDGTVALLTLATGTVADVSAKIESDKAKGEGENFPAPVWRAAGEFTFLRRNETASGSPFELVLRRGQAETVLSRNWEASLLRRLLD